MSTYEEDCRARMVRIKEARISRYHKAAAQLASILREELEEIAQDSAYDVPALFQWREWATQLLYGKDCASLPHLDQDLRAWIEERARGGAG